MASQHLNFFLNHLTLELNNLLTLGGVVQNSAVDTQVGTAVQNVAQKALAIMNCVRVTTGSALTVPLGSGTIVTALGSGSTYTVTLPAAASAIAVGFEVDIQNWNAGATNMLGSGYGSVLVNLLNVNDGLAGFTNGTWQITEQYGHLLVRPALSGNPSGYGWVVESCEGSIYRSVVSASQTQVSAAQNTWYNKGGSLPYVPGSFELKWSGNMQCAASNTVVQATLSTANNSESDQDLSAEWIMGTASQTCDVPASRSKRFVAAAAGTLFLNARTTSVATPTIGFAAGPGQGNVIIELKRVA